MESAMNEARMEPASLSIPIEHLRRVHEIRAIAAPDPDEVSLGQLVEAVAEFSASEREVIATVMHMLRTGRVKLVQSYAEPTTTKLCG